MKFSFLSLMILINIQIWSQSTFYNQVPLTDRHWIVDYYHNWPDYEQSIRKFYFTDTTTYFNGQAYHELVSHVYDNPNEIRRTNDYFRIEGNKLIYLLYQRDEVVFEDFDLEVGDTIFMDQTFWPGKSHVISKIDTVTYLDGKPRLRHFYYCDSDIDTEPSFFLTYVQGLSTPERMFTQDYSCTLLDKPYFTGIRCYYENEQLVYTSSGIGIDSCYIKVGTNDIQYSALIISPNPTSDYIDVSISDDMMLPLHYEIINIAGQRVEMGSQMSANDLHIETDQYARGMYIIQLRDKVGKVWRGKVVLE